MRLHRLLAVLVGAAALSSCEKNGVQELTGAAPGARIRFFNFGLNAPQLNFYAGANKVTAVNSTQCALLNSPGVRARSPYACLA